MRRAAASSPWGPPSEGLPSSSSSSSSSSGRTGAAGDKRSSSSSNNSSRSSSSRDRVPSWVCLSVSYMVIGLHLSSTYLSLQRGPCHFASLRVVLIALNAVYVIAFRSFALQADALLGPKKGLLPLDRQQHQLQQLQQLPASVPVSLLLSAVSSIARHISRRTHNFKLSHVCWMGLFASAFNICLSLLLPAGLSRWLWETVSCLLQFVLYLSLRYFGREFMAFQWDVLLLEFGFICCFGPAALGVGSHFSVSLILAMLRLLLFKILFSSAVSKCAAAASHWRDLTALHFHYWTQPLPSPGAWYAYWSRWKKLQAAAVLLVEGVLSFCVFWPTSSLRSLALIAICALAVCVLLTGNVGFLPHLTLALSLCLLDDALLGASAPRPVSLSFFQRCASMGGSLLISALLGIYFLVYTAACLHYFCKIWLRPGLSAPSWCLQLCKELSLICACNAYGLFSVVTTGRFEVVLEELHSTPDEKPQWFEVYCSYKPGDTNASPPWLWWGHFPRLDWRLWFIPLRLRSVLGDAIKGRRTLQQPQQQQGILYSALGSSPSEVSPYSPFVSSPGDASASPLYPPFWSAFLHQLCNREPALLQLMGVQGEALKRLPPPKSLRISLYDYRMAPPEGLPLYTAFFPQGCSHLSTQDILKLEEDLAAHWTAGRWWLRRHHQTIDVLSFCPSRPSNEESLQ